MSGVTVNGGGGGWVALVILYVMFIGDPDLYDMIMRVLENMADVASDSGDER